MLPNSNGRPAQRRRRKSSPAPTATAPKVSDLGFLEEKWLDRFGTAKQKLTLADDDQEELGWMGFYRAIPAASDRQRIMRGIPLEDQWTAVLKKYALAEYNTLAGLSRVGGKPFSAFTQSFFRSKVDDATVKRARQALDLALQSDGLPENIDDMIVSSSPKLLHALVVSAFGSLPDEQQRQIVFAKGKLWPSYPSAEWWSAVRRLATAELDRIHRKHSVQQSIRREKIQERKDSVALRKVQLTRRPIPEASLPDFQDFIKSVVFAEHGDDAGKNNLPFPVYPDYMRLPEGPMTKGGSKGRFHDVRAMLETSADPSKATDGCSADTRQSSSGGDLQPQQAIVNAMLQLRANGLIRTPGLLAWHSTGAGKTLLTTCALLAFWNKKATSTPAAAAPGRPCPIFLVSVKSNNDDNGPEQLARLACAFFADFKDEFTSTFPFKTGNEASAAQHISERLRKGLLGAARSPAQAKVLAGRGRTMYTFQTLGNDLYSSIFPSKIKDALFVVDEAHYMNIPYNAGAKLNKCYEDVRKLLTTGRDPTSTWCLAMTATPGETKEEVHALLKAVSANPAFPAPANSRAFREALRGLVSYAQLYGDFSHFARMDPRVVEAKLDTATSEYARLYARRLCSLPEFARSHGKEPRRNKTSAAAAAARNKKGLHTTTGFCHKTTTWNEDKITEKRHINFLRECSNFIAVKVKDDGGSSSSSGWTRHNLQGSGTPSSTVDTTDTNNATTTRRATRQRGAARRNNNNNNAPSSNAKSSGSRSRGEEMADDDDDGAFAWGDGFDGDGFDDIPPTLHTRDGTGGYAVYVSPKVQMLVQNLLKLPKGKHYVYSGSKATLAVIARLLMTQGKYEPLQCPPAPTVAAAALEKRPRFLLLDQINSKKSHAQGLAYASPTSGKVYSGKELAACINNGKKVFNAPENVNGDLVKIVLATADHFKGVDLNHLRYLHLVDSMQDYQDFLQFVGRGSRYCGHRWWPKMSQRKVTLLFYRLSLEPRVNNPLQVTPKLQSDLYLFDNSVASYDSTWGVLEDVIQQESIDYHVFKDNIHRNVAQVRRALRNTSSASPATTATTATTSSTTTRRGDKKKGYVMSSEKKARLQELARIRKEKVRAARQANIARAYQAAKFETHAGDSFTQDLILDVLARDPELTQRRWASLEEVKGFVRERLMKARRTNPDEWGSLLRTRADVEAMVMQVAQVVFERIHKLRQ